MLTITEYDIPHISHAKSIHHNALSLDFIDLLRTVLLQLQHIARLQDHYVFLRYPHLLGNIALSQQMLVFTMHRNGIFRFHKRIDKLYFFLAGMSRYVGVLNDNLRSLKGQLIDHLGDGFLISRYRPGTKNNHIPRFNGDLPMDTGSNARQRSHSFSLASRRDQHQLVIRIIPHLLQCNDHIIRNLDITKLHRRIYNIHHTAALDHYLAVLFLRRIDHLLYPVHIRGKGSNDNAAPSILFKYRVKCFPHRALRHSKARFQYIGTVAHQGQHTLLSQLAKACQINRITKDRCIIHFKVACMHDHTGGCIDCQGGRIRDTVVCADKFNAQVPQIDILPICDNLSLHTIDQVVLLQFILNDSHRQLCSIDRNIQLL